MDGRDSRGNAGEVSGGSARPPSRSSLASMSGIADNGADQRGQSERA